VFIVEIPTKTGPLCESFATFEEAKHRIDGMPADSLAGMPLIFQELADGSQRLVREDGKPLQWHRLPGGFPAGPPEPVPLADGPSLGAPIPRTVGSDEIDDEPIPLCDEPLDLGEVREVPPEPPISDL
jgi:hypothetical protein